MNLPGKSTDQRIWRMNMQSTLLKFMLAAALAACAGCVAKVETDPAPAKVNVDVDPPPDIKVKVD
jgi:hypothetical protein